MKKVLLSIVLGISGSIIPFHLVSAHPLDEIGNINVYDQKQTLILSPKESVLKIDLTFYAIEKIKVWESIDTNRDQKLSQEEKDNWMSKGLSASKVTKSGEEFFFSPLSIEIPEYFDFFATPPAKVSIAFKSIITASPGETIVYSYYGKDKKLSEINFEVIGNSGIIASNVSTVDSDNIKFVIDKGNQSIALQSNLKTGERLNSFLNKYVKADEISASLFLTSIAVAFLIGLLHALTPGHGKAIVAGYLVGEKGTVWHAIQLGLIITITHTSSVFLLGLGALFLTEYVVPATVIKWLNLISGFLVTGFGIYLFITRLKKLRHHFLNLEEAEAHELLHSHSHTHTHANFPRHNHDTTELKLTWKNLLPLGISGGIVPCIDALAILIVAVSLGKLMLGMALLVVFSLGLASALILGGVSVVIMKNKAMDRISFFSRYERYISLISAGIVIILGLAILMGKPV